MALSRIRNSPDACSSSLTATASPLTDVPPQTGPGPWWQARRGGAATRGRVFRVGDTVVRPTAPCWPATHALLGHLAAVGFDGAPRVLAARPATEVLDYPAGRA